MKKVVFIFSVCCLFFGACDQYEEFEEIETESTIDGTGSDPGAGSKIPIRGNHGG